VRETTVTVADGKLQIQFRRQVNDPIVDGIEVIAVAGGGSDTVPPSVPANLHATNVTSSQVDLAWDASIDPAPGSGIASYEVFVNGTSAGPVSTTSYSAAGLDANTAYTFTVRAIDGQGNMSAQSNPLAVTTSPAGGTLLRIDSGATAPFVDSQGRTWQADFGFNASSTSFKADAISGTVEDVLYHTVRYDPAAAPELLYTLPVANGVYTVRLHFVEKYSGAFAVGARVFDIDIEGIRAFEDVDIFAAVGARAAYVRETTTTVADGALHIQFHRQVGDPNISAIEVIPQ